MAISVLKPHPNTGAYKSGATDYPIEQSEHAGTVMIPEHQFQVLVLGVCKSELRPQIMEQCGGPSIVVAPFLEVGCFSQHAQASIDSDGRIDRVIPRQSIVAQVKCCPGFAPTLVTKAD